MLTISIPDDIDKQLSSLTDDKEKFIIAAIRQQIVARKKMSLPKNLQKNMQIAMKKIN